MRYGDPLQLALQAEAKRLGCKACKWHLPRKDGRGHHCEMGCKQWPDGGKGSCVYWFKGYRHAPCASN